MWSLLLNFHVIRIKDGPIGFFTSSQFKIQFQFFFHSYSQCSSFLFVLYLEMFFFFHSKSSLLDSMSVCFPLCPCFSFHCFCSFYFHLRHFIKSILKSFTVLKLFKYFHDISLTGEIQLKKKDVKSQLTRIPVCYIFVYFISYV